MGLTEMFIAGMSLKDDEEGFTDDPKKPAKDYMVASLLAAVVYVLLIGFFGKFLWNNYLAKYVTIVKEVKGPVDIIAISVLLGLLYGKI